MSEHVTYLEAIRLALRRALAEDERVILLGEDIGLGGGAFKVTESLLDEFGPERVRDTPISESAFTGVSCWRVLWRSLPLAESGSLVPPLTWP